VIFYLFLTGRNGHNSRLKIKIITTVIPAEAGISGIAGKVSIYMKQFYIYILTNKKYGVLYIGVTNNLERRIYEHKNKLVDGFTKKYNLDKLVHFEETESVRAAIEREKQLKKWNRRWKLNLINRDNPEWEDLAEKLFN
jgi:putative endonuclease